MGIEENERLPRGLKGERGEAGARGPGLSWGTRRGFVYLSLLMLLLTALNLLWTSRQTGASNARAGAQCHFDADLGGAPVAADPKTGKPSLLAVTIVSDARTAWHQAACAGQLPAPSPSFRQWAAAYNLPAG
ncbi:MAG TPA: hypothetical protein VK817_00725 [Trebonia sp.]|jgi:hypothetical protein|nr:hypothetical protein [Trebonia sp.]